MSRFSAVVLVVAAACGTRANVKIDTPVVRAKVRIEKQAPVEDIVPATPNIGVAQEVVDECTVQLADLGKAPKFDYDASELLAQDRELLDRVATCVISGPLAGRTIELVGRADPRGSQEYNLGLGNRRARTVATYLERIGVPDKQISTTTRGDLDAQGKDESTWRGDRRVDLQLATTAASK